MHSNADNEEIAKFSNLAHRWWDPESEFKPLHEINPLRLKWINDHTPLAGKRVLDIGCGGGILSESMACKGAIVTGIDLSEKALAVARLHLHESQQSVDYQKISAENFATHHQNEFDIVTCMEMLEHVPSPSSIVQACATLVKPGGHVFLSTINRNFKAYLLTIIGAEYIANMLPRGTHNYSKFLKPSELAGDLRKSDLNVLELIGMNYNPLSKEYSLGRNTDVNYLICATKPYKN
jgi:2-polyprenyl-6-hydroxyphenyl methylase / 3-demethylubiquinone-9 3-methyltransferase